VQHIWKLISAASLCVAACATAQKKTVIESAAGASDTQRRDAFEATARVLDENPEYVDEFYVILRKHPKTLSRFFADVTPDLDQKPLAETQAKLLAEHPASLEVIFRETIDAAKDRPKARAALTRVMQQRATLLADLTTDNPQTVAALLNATTAALVRKPKAQPGFHVAMKESAPHVAALMAKDTSTLGVLMEEMLKVSVRDKPALRKLLDKVGALD
jgi:hypothetical protein